MGTEPHGPPGTVADGRYELDQLVGVGGMGEVWSARDGRLDRRVVVKLLKQQLSGDPSVRRRFETEARAAARLGHPNVVAVFDTGDHHGRPYIVMERLPGPTLAEELRGGPLPVDAALAVAGDVLAGLAAAHAAGVVHRDVKPANVIRSDRATWKVADFGIAKAAGADQTAPGVLYGTPTYLAPEVLAGGASSPASDIYSVGVLLHEALTGQAPPPPGDPGDRPLAATRPDVPPAVAAAVDRARSADPSARFAGAGEMGAALGVSATQAAAVPADPAPTALLAAAPAVAPAGSRRRRSANAVLAVAVALFVALVVAGAVIGAGGEDAPPAPPETVADTAPPPPPAAGEDVEEDEGGGGGDDDDDDDDDERGGGRGKKGRG